MDQVGVTGELDVNDYQKPGEPQAADVAAVDDIIEIREPEIDVEAIMAHIRANLATRDEEGQPVRFPSFTMDPSHEREGNGPLSEELYYNLGQLNLNYDQIWVDSTLESRPVPVIEPLIRRLKHEFHNLSVYYVNLLAGKQVSFNAHATRIFNQMVKELERKEAEVDALRQEVDALRQRLARLEGAEDE